MRARNRFFNSDSCSRGFSQSACRKYMARSSSKLDVSTDAYIRVFRSRLNRCGRSSANGKVYRLRRMVR